MRAGDVGWPCALFWAGERGGELLPTAAAPWVCFEGVSSCPGFPVLCVPAWESFGVSDTCRTWGPTVGWGALREAPVVLL